MPLPRRYGLPTPNRPRTAIWLTHLQTCGSISSVPEMSNPGFAPTKTFANRCHDVYFAGILGFSFLKALVVNSWRDPKYFVLQLKMIARFIGWRFLGKSRNGEI
ncbi:hypothetical protein [Pandoraea pnomenusa]|nr:hypothetical protein [Pandoraea pnomenusa]